MKALWHNTVIAESNNTIVVEGNHYFPPESINHAYLTKTEHTTTCGWKGVANYYSVVVDGKVNANAAWVYHTPKEQAANIKDYLAFWKGVEVTQ
jgi:uncharacterized protein (DUF427 family)